VVAPSLALRHALRPRAALELRLANYLTLEEMELGQSPALILGLSLR
jgi:hypothetical protein